MEDMFSWNVCWCARSTFPSSPRTDSLQVVTTLARHVRLFCAPPCMWTKKRIIHSVLWICIVTQVDWTRIWSAIMAPSVGRCMTKHHLRLCFALRLTHRRRCVKRPELKASILVFCLTIPRNPICAHKFLSFGSKLSSELFFDSRQILISQRGGQGSYWQHRPVLRRCINS
jgi:hypothetical protein